MNSLGITNSLKHSSLYTWPKSASNKEKYDEFYSKMPLNLFIVLTRQQCLTYEEIVDIYQFWKPETYSEEVREWLERYKGCFDVMFETSINLFNGIFSEATGCYLTRFLFKNLVENEHTLSDIDVIFDIIEKRKSIF